MKPMPAPISSTRSPGRTMCGIWLDSSASNRPARMAARIAGVITAGSRGITTPADSSASGVQSTAVDSFIG